MGDFIGQLRARQAQINAEIGQHLSAIAALSNELSDIASAGRVFAGIVSTKTNSPDEANEPGAGSQPVKVEGSSLRANVSTGVTSGERPAQYPYTAADWTDLSGDVRGGDTPGTMSDVSAAMNTLLEGGQGETREGELGEIPGETARSGEDRHGPQVLSNTSHATDKSGAASSDKAAPAPSLAERLRALNAIHPEFTLQQAAAELCETYERVRNNSNVNKIKWGLEHARSIGLQDRVVEVHQEHPDWTDAEIAAALGKSNGYVRATAQRLGIVLPSRKRPAPVAEAEPVEADPPAEAPEPAPEPESPPASTPEPAIEASGDHRAAVSGRRFWLVNDAGLYLNRFGTGFTADRRNAWDGNEKQLAGIRRSYSIARDLREKPVTKEQTPVPVNREVA